MDVRVAMRVHYLRDGRGKDIEDEQICARHRAFRLGQSGT